MDIYTSFTIIVSMIIFLAIVYVAKKNTPVSVPVAPSPVQPVVVPVVPNPSVYYNYSLPYRGGWGGWRRWGWGGWRR